MVLREGFTKILNIDLDVVHWFQANLPVNAGGLGMSSAVKLAPSAFLDSAASTLSLQNLILPSRIASVSDIDVRDDSSSLTIFQVYQNHRLKFGTYRKFWIIRSSTVN